MATVVPFTSTQQAQLAASNALTLAQGGNLVLAGPSGGAGAVAPRSLVPADLAANNSFRHAIFLGTFGINATPLPPNNTQTAGYYCQQTTFNAQLMPTLWAGSVVGIGVNAASAPVGNCTFQIVKNGSLFGCFFTATLTSNNATYGTTFPKGTFPINAFDNFGANFRNDTGATINAFNGAISLWVECGS